MENNSLSGSLARLGASAPSLSDDIEGQRMKHVPVPHVSSRLDTPASPTWDHLSLKTPAQQCDLIGERRWRAQVRCSWPSVDLRGALARHHYASSAERCTLPLSIVPGNPHRMLLRLMQNERLSATGCYGSIASSVLSSGISLWSILWSQEEDQWPISSIDVSLASEVL